MPGQKPRHFLSVMKSILEEEFHQPLSDLFDHIDSTPLASASIVQVHAARLKSGEDVVLKIQSQESKISF